MTYYSLLFYPAIILLIAFYDCKACKKNEYIEDCFNKDQAKAVQALACLFVILHHLTQMISSYGDIYRGPITILSSMGILFTSIFFFFSGYGLIVSVSEKEAYLNNFLKHRLTIILVPFFIANIIAVLVRTYLINVKMTVVQIIKCILGYILINGNGWYIVEIFFLYLAFYCLFRVIKNKKIASALLCIFAIFLIYIGYKSGHDTNSIGDHWFKGEWWYNSTIVFVMGVILGNYKDKIIGFIKKNYFVFISIFSILFVVSFIIEERIRKVYGYYKTSYIGGVNGKLVTLISQSELCLVFTALILLIMMKVSIESKAIKWVGERSMEIFLLHGLFINYIPNISRMNVFIAYGLVVVLGILSAAIIHFIDQKIIIFISRFGRKKDYLKDCGIDLIRERKAKKRKIACYVLVSIVTVLVIYGLIKRLIIIPNEYKSEIRKINEASVNDIVEYGRYETTPEIPGKEHLLWIVMKKENNRIMLLSKHGIESSVYHNKSTEIAWKDSKLYKFLNEELYENAFSENEKNSIATNPDTGEKVSLLSADEALDLLTDNYERQIFVTSYAKKKGVNVNELSKIDTWNHENNKSSWWWLKGDKGITAPIVTPEGVVELDSKYVNKPNGAVRPVIWVDITE